MKYYILPEQGVVITDDYYGMEKIEEYKERHNIDDEIIGEITGKEAEDAIKKHREIVEAVDRFYGWE